MVKSTFGYRLKRLRTQKHMSMMELAEAAGISRQTVHALEGDTSRPQWRTVRKLSLALGVDISEFGDELTD